MLDATDLAQIKHVPLDDTVVESSRLFLPAAACIKGTQQIVSSDTL
jgi:hypothetical protein